jgi:hypothetical protein
MIAADDLAPKTSRVMRTDWTAPDLSSRGAQPESKGARVSDSIATAEVLAPAARRPQGRERIVNIT